MPKRADAKKIPLRTTFAFVGGMFVATGCAGLLAEQCFEKLLTGLTGSSTPAAAIVLSVYFIGLADLLTNKRAAGRHKDLDDVEHLSRSRGAQPRRTTTGSKKDPGPSRRRR